MLITVKAVSKFGVMDAATDKWVNVAKGANVSLAAVQKGQAYEFNTDAKGLIIGIGGATASTPQTVPQSTQSHAKSSPEVQSQICRGNACNAILGSPAMVEMVKGMDVSEASGTLRAWVEKTAKYIATGSWE